MDELNLYELKFTTGHDSDTRYVRIYAATLKDTESQLFKMYCSVNTTLLGSKEIFNEFCSCNNGEPDYCAGHDKLYCSSCLKEMKE